MRLFELIKNNITVKTAAEAYGFTPNRSGLIKCPFHKDRKASMKVDDRYYCFGCGCTGDVIDFTSRIFGLNLKDAAMKLAHDFGLNHRSKKNPREGRDRSGKEADSYKKEITSVVRIFLDDHIVLEEIKNKYAPKTMSDDWNEQFVIAVHQLSLICYYQEILLFGEEDDKIELLKEKRGEVEIIEKFCKRYWEEKNRERFEMHGRDGAACSN